MSYEPLHHKYRPKSFAELVGQEAIATTLTNAIRTAKIAPAYLFTGPRGTGKTSSARILAKSLNCLKSDKPTAEPCGLCDVCRGITKGYTLDVIEIDAASNTGVDNIRELIEKAQFAPVQCRYKVYVVDECLTGDSLVLTDDGLNRIDDPKIKDKRVLSYNDSSDKWEFKKVVRWLDQGERQTLVIKTTNREIRCTANHLIRTNQGWLPAKDVKEGVKILSPVNVADFSRDLENLSPNLSPRRGEALNSPPSLVGKGAGGLGFTLACLDEVNVDASSSSITSLETVESVHLAGVERVYDIEVADNHNFVANGLLVHNCHMLSTQAFNALLKTLEEPPRHVVFILATTDPQRVLPTIISRCQRFDFRRIQLEAMSQHLTMIALKESINILPESITLVAQIAQGGLRDAESLLDQLALLSGEVTPDQVWDLVGSVSERDLLGLLSAIAEDDPEAVLDSTRSILDRGREPLTILQNLANFYRDLLIAKTAPKRHDLIACTQQTWTDLVNFAQHLNVNAILAGQKHLREAELQIKNTTQPRLWLEVTLLGLLPSANMQPVTMGISPHVSTPVVAPSTHRPSSPPANSFQQPITPPSPVSPPPPPESLPVPSSSTEEKPFIASVQPVSSVSTSEEVIGATQLNLTQLWQQVLGNIQQIPRRALLGQMCHLIEFDGAVARVGVKPKWYDKVKSDLPTITGAFQQTCNRDIQVSLEKETSLTSASVRKEPPANGSPTVQQPPPPRYNSQNTQPAPTPQPPPQQVPSAAKTEAAVGAGKLPTSPPVATQTPPSDWETDEVAIAAQRLAKFFDGQIIRFTDDAGELSDSVTASEWVEESEDDD